MCRLLLGDLKLLLILQRHGNHGPLECRGGRGRGRSFGDLLALELVLQPLEGGRRRGRLLMMVVLMAAEGFMHQGKGQSRH